jgi:uncharacterized protein (TIGR03067 family)
MTLATGLALAAAPPQSGKSDHQLLQGTWKVVSIQARGEDDSDESVKDLTVVITKDKLSFKRGDKPAGEAVYKLDTTKKPRWIDFNQDARQGLKSLGIYRLAGDDLVLCFAPGTKKEQRPTAFKTTRDTEHRVLMILKREMP